MCSKAAIHQRDIFTVIKRTRSNQKNPGLKHTIAARGLIFRKFYVNKLEVNGDGEDHLRQRLSDIIERRDELVPAVVGLPSLSIQGFSKR